ncbi:ligase-associated DNA damage response endonuclease PdeM [Flavobacterium silvaticum]|uniref:Ligase-associated DNA damage response endonuclease PdeM n=1 Tax=Flavobacterium silvaticum TaxID=1852020 RepID=A0A972FQ73_9FLAO|nr:ligase-associated DNA damage response endonuclease PdeM [Flavobacterium silvaticum]NMH27379.1 ligase-associated DNA damage response endonuclease PdeM [Flavobacterium silvaticum]
MEISIEKNHFELHHSGAIFWKEKSMLLISDVHLGKVSHFRKHGIAVPENAFLANFRRLTEVADYFGAELICFLGDLFHSKKNKEWDIFCHWTQSRPEKILLVTGNHDILKPEAYAQARIIVTSEFVTDAFLFTHEPEIRENHFTFCGHIHPGVTLRGVGRQFMSLSCFYLEKQQLILPAFGEFTGKWIVEPQQHARIFALTPRNVVEITLLERNGR